MVATSDTKNLKPQEQERRDAHMGFETFPSQKREILAVAKRHCVGYASIIRLCVDKALNEVDKELTQMKGLL